ncbi:MAG: permease [Anaerolinea sp.]|nr:permease [Anaerolinea sp.]
MQIHPDHHNIFEETIDHKPNRKWEALFIGKPIATADAGHQAIGKLVGLAVFSSDALSSVAYGPQELMTILLVAGVAALHLSLPLVIGIVILLAIITFSYEQTIHAYPGGGGAYIVARDNLGELPAQTAGAALMMDYILTVAVSISSGVAQLTSAYAALYPYRVEIAVALIVMVMVINLRGVKESGTTFAIPTYFFLVMMFITLILGLIKYATGSLGMVVNPPTVEMDLLQPITVFLILKAFANGTTSLTGVEAISNGITAFKEPRSKNAGTTLVWMAGILGSMLIATTFLAIKIGALPAESETVISQIARTVYANRGFLYLATISSTTVILIMAANTAYADFPRLGALIAGDGFLPKQLTAKGSRLVFSRGISSLAFLSALLVILFKASVSGLIPLYAIGVFLSFTLSQTGMARRWWKSGHLKPGEEIVEPGSTLKHTPGWKFKMIVNGFGGFLTALVMTIFAVTKFKDGAWIVVLIIPLLVFGFYTIHHHYKDLATQLSLDTHVYQKRVARNRVLMPIGGVHNGTLMALKYARTLSMDITALHISIDPKETEKIEEKWIKWGDGVRLVVLHSPYREFLEPLLEYIDQLSEELSPNEVITIVVPQFVPRRLWTRFLHMRTAEIIRKSLLNLDNIVILEVPYQVK